MIAGGASLPTCRFWQLWALDYDAIMAELQERRRKADETAAKNRRRRSAGLRAV